MSWVLGPLIDPGEWVLYRGNWAMVADIKIDAFGQDDYLILDNGDHCYSSQVREYINSHQLKKTLEKHREKMRKTFTARAKTILRDAAYFGNLLGFDSINSICLLLAISKEGTGLGASVLKNNGYAYSKLKLSLANYFNLNYLTNPENKLLENNSKVLEILQSAIQYSNEIGDTIIGTEHLLCGIVKHGNNDAFLFLDDVNVAKQIEPDLNQLLGRSDQNAVPSIPQDVALDCLQMLRDAGYGQEGSATTLWGMVKDVCQEVKELRERVKNEETCLDQKD